MSETVISGTTVRPPIVLTGSPVSPTVLKTMSGASSLKNLPEASSAATCPISQSAMVSCTNRYTSTTRQSDPLMM